MVLFLLVLFLFGGTRVFSQGTDLTLFPNAKILATGYSALADDVRALLIDTETGTITDLGFNGSFLPVWKGDSILVSTSTGVWLVDKAGQKMKKLYKGKKIILSPDNTYSASFTEQGIIVYHFANQSAFELSLTADIFTAITWLPNNAGITYFNSEYNETRMYRFADGIEEDFGYRIVQPVWSRSGSFFVYQKFSGANYGIYIGHGTLPSKNDSCISDGKISDLVPVISENEQFIFFLRLNPANIFPNQYLYPTDLYVYDRKSKVHRFLDEQVAYTDGFYPQISFDSEAGVLYYSVLSNSGETAVPVALLLATGQKTVIETGYHRDIRFPTVHPNP